MESTKIIESLKSLRETFQQPVSDMEIIRRTLAAQTARLNGVEMPPILNADQRKVFSEKLDLLSDFLESEDGADAVELLLNAFREFVTSREKVDEVEQVEGNPS